LPFVYAFSTVAIRIKVHGLHLCAHSLITTGETPRCNWGDQSLVKTTVFFLQC